MTNDNPYQPPDSPAVRRDENGHYVGRGFLFHPLIRVTSDSDHGRRLYRLDEPLVFVACDRPGYRSVVVVPEGFKTDLATVPRCLWWLYPPNGPWLQAAVVHDYLCGQRFDDTETLPEVTRFHADCFLRIAMDYLDDVRPGSRISFYYAVRIFGILSGFFNNVTRFFRRRNKRGI